MNNEICWLCRHPAQDHDEAGCTHACTCHKYSELGDQFMSCGLDTVSMKQLLFGKDMIYEATCSACRTKRSDDSSLVAAMWAADHLHFKRDLGPHTVHFILKVPLKLLSGLTTNYVWCTCGGIVGGPYATSTASMMIKQHYLDVARMEESRGLSYTIDS